ncbi:hypothetical protein T4C_8205 [Trichinella pseudospiralis]|uniref:Uncharacterized protein n=1 Tax=Trichinella pseudospiralis TaxID=6337 RepID=A0A0V1GAK7_TRIPS|nr:hypothetical protein T4C_8205 [Trichinella pseudospiralis]
MSYSDVNLKAIGTYRIFYSKISIGTSPAFLRFS